MSTQPVSVRVKHTRATAKVPSNFASSTQVKDAMLAKLSESALTAKEATKLSIQPFTAEQVAHLQLPFNRAGFKIPYFDVNGKPTKFFRFRYLEYDNGKGFSKLTHNGNGNGNGHTKALKHDLRYVQPANTLPEIYFPTNVVQPWSKVLQNATIPLVITEGELKAACACKHGMFCIGLGGVWSWKSKKEGMYVLPILKQIAWTYETPDEPGKKKPRPVLIVFDSDAVSNANVHMAENALAHELTQLGADVSIFRMPQLDGEKTGLDDYLVKTGDSALAEVPSERWSESKELFKLNEEVMYVQNPGLVLKLDTMQRMAPSAFADHQYANRIWHTFNAAGNLVPKNAAKEWIKWPQRAQIERITYQPGAPKFISAELLNMWPGWGCQPEEGDVKLWIELLDYAFADYTDSEARKHWFQQWLAYPLQYPGTKLYQSAVMWSVAQGTGKSLIGYCLQQIYGRNFTEIGDRNLQGNFNEWAENKQFVMGDEIASTGDKRRDTAERMKSMITQRELRLNPKYIPSYTVPDCINYYFTSNHCDAFFVDPTDRRFFVNEIKRRPKPKSFYDAVTREFATDGCRGARALFHHLLHYDLQGFDPQGAAPVTTSKLEMISSSQGDAAVWCAMLKEDPDQLLKLGNVVLPYKLWTAKELYALFNPDGNNRTNEGWFGKAMRAAGFRQWGDAALVRTKTKGVQRLWMVRDAEAIGLLKKGPDVADIYDKERAGKTKGAKY